MRALFGTLLLVTALTAMALAGCTGDTDGGDDASTTTSTSRSASGTATPTRSATASATASSSSTSSSSPVANAAPTAGISVVVNGTLAAFSLTGGDADGDDLAWNLTFGDGGHTTGAVLPANATHTYAVGNFTAELAVSDGQQVVKRNVTVSVTGGGTDATVQTASLTWNAAASGCLAEYPAIPPAAPAGNVAYGLVEVAAASIGRPYTAVITWTAGPLPLGADISFYDADGMYIDGNLVSGSSPVTAVGKVPAGSAFAVFTLCDAATSGSATYVVT